MPSERIAVIGAGLMGHALAQVFADAGHPVALRDPHPETLASAPARAAANLQSLGRDPAVAEAISLHAELAEAVAKADFVFEAGPERPELKRDIFVALERHAPREAILATNTSVIPVGVVGEKVTTAERVVGTHWWNPPYLVPIVEVVQADRTSDETVERTIDL